METPSNGEQRTIKITLPAIDDQPDVSTPGQRGPAKIADLSRDPSAIRLAALTTPVVAPPEELKTQAPGILELKCVRMSGLLNRDETNADSPKASQPAQCLYMSVDMQDLFQQPIRNKRERNRIVFLLMNISDGNCTTFLHRFYATKAGWDAAHNTGKDMATAIAAGTARVASGFSGVLGLVNLAGGTAIDNVDKSYYSEKTIQAITAAIKSLRATSKKRVLDGATKELNNYSYFEALNDLGNFDNDCSLQRGIEQIAELANNASIDAEKRLDTDRNLNVTEMQKDLDAARKEKDEAVRLRTEFQQQLIKAKDDAERKVLQDQIKALGDQVQKAGEDVSRLRSSLPTATSPNEKPSDLQPPKNERAPESKPAETPKNAPAVTPSEPTKDDAKAEGTGIKPKPLS